MECRICRAQSQTLATGLGRKVSAGRILAPTDWPRLICLCNMTERLVLYSGVTTQAKGFGARSRLRAVDECGAPKAHLTIWTLRRLSERANPGNTDVARLFDDWKKPNRRSHTMAPKAPSPRKRQPRAASKETGAPASMRLRGIPSDPGEAGASGDAPPLGARIRRLRQERGWKLAELSARSGIAISTLSKVETGALSLAYDRLLSVANAFGLGLSEFLAPPQTEPRHPTLTGRISFARHGSGAHVVTPGYNYFYLCEKLRLKSMVPILSECRARTMDEFGPLLRHEGEEFTFVVKGRVHFISEFYGPELLEEGEGVYIDSRMGHAYLNAGPGPCWILSVNHTAGDTARNTASSG